LLSAGLEKEAGQGRTYSQDVGSSPTKELNWACGRKDETWVSGTPWKINMEQTHWRFGSDHFPF